jgi:glucose/arabinose dehydrogenase/galactose mutarotase-like enzyme
MGSLRLVVTLVALVLSQAVIAGEIFPYEDPETGSKIYTLKQGSTVARLSPSNGANVFSIEVAGIEYLTPPPDMHDFFGLFYGTPVLYPTPNRVRNARFTFEGREYTLTPNLPPNRIHGLVLDADWKVVGTETTNTSAAVQVALDFREGSRLFEEFPFPHRVLLTIEVKADAVRWMYEVDNTEGTEPVPFGFGLHPGFVYQGARENTWVTLPASHKMEAKDFFPTGRLIPADELDFRLGEPFSLQGRNFDDVFWGLRSTEPAFIDFRDKNREITMSASESFSHVVLYSPDKNSFSVEHQTSSTDAHNLHAAGKVGEASLQICPPGETRSGWVEYRFRLTGDVEWVFEDEGFALSLQHCESCHGFAFTGARTQGLWNGDWQHAETAADISRVIANGIPGTEMPAFGGLLDDSQIESLTTLMVELLQKYPREMVDAALEVSHDQPRQSYRETFRLETVVDGLNIPWSIAFLPDESIIVTERDGYLRLVDDGKLSEPIRGTPRVWARQDGGLLAMALDPAFDENDWIYLSYSDPGDTPGTSMTRIVRGRIADHAWVDEEVLWQAPVSFYTESNAHYGTRLLLDGDYLYFSVGDRGERSQAQDLSSPFGKVHRIYRDGGVPADNPFVAEAGAYASVWSFGHRNPQGLTLSPDDTLWSTEHGPTGGDELNRIEAARNFGWPATTHGTEMDGSPISSHSSLPGMVDPEYVWPETLAPSNIAFYDGERFPGWRGSLFVASLTGQELRRIEIEDGKFVSQELLLKMIGRIRDVQVGPGGYIYLAVERYGGHGGILRLVPASIPSTPVDTGDFRLD